MPKRNKPYTIKYIQQQLKKQGCWKLYNKRLDGKDKFGYDVDFYWYYYEDKSYYSAFSIQLELQVTKNLVYSNRFFTRHFIPTCLHHEYFHHIRTQQDIEHLPVIAIQMKRLSEFDFGGYPQRFLNKVN